jgi:acyl-CoA thioester hydrolase
VRYEIGLFKSGVETAAAIGHFVHVFVGRADMRPVPIPEKIRVALKQLCNKTGSAG